MLHWGFAASPAYLAPSGQAALVNAVHYIAGFAGEPAYVRKAPSALTRATYDDLLYQFTEEGAAAVAAIDSEIQSAVKAHRAALHERQDAGIELSVHEQQILKLPLPPKMTRSMLMGYIVPETVRRQFGEEWDAIGS